jgi:hypothetical protein
MKSLRHTINQLITTPDKGIFIYIDSKMGAVIMECRSIEGGDLLTNPQAIPLGELSMAIADAVDLTGVDLIKKAKRALHPGQN